MKKNCLNPDDINRLEARRMRGRRLADALLHLESCGDCRARIKPARIEEILRRIAAGNPDESPPFYQGLSPTENRKISAGDHHQVRKKPEDKNREEAPDEKNTLETTTAHNNLTREESPRESLTLTNLAAAERAEQKRLEEKSLEEEREESFRELLESIRKSKSR